MRLSRGHPTWLLYSVFASMAFLLNGLGAVLIPLQRELRVHRADVAFYPTLFALGLVLVGVTGGALVGRLGRATALRLSIGGMLLGGLLFAVPGRLSTLLGAIVVGLASALLIQLLPALMAGFHPGAATATVGEANGLASAASVLAPLAVATALSTGLGWRIGYLTLPLLALAAAMVPIWRLAPPAAPVPGRHPTPGTRAPMLARWVELVLAVSVEFCMVFWAASALADWHHASAGQAAAVASLFLVGMATGRLLAGPVTRRLGGTRALVLACVAAAGAGFALFWVGPSLVLSGAGLAVTGLGVALLYPTTVNRVVGAWPDAPDRAAARAALGSGLAIAAAPFLLGRLSDTIGLRSAYLIVPALLLLLAIRQSKLRLG